MICYASTGGSCRAAEVFEAENETCSEEPAERSLSHQQERSNQNCSRLYASCKSLRVSDSFVVNQRSYTVIMVDQWLMVGYCFMVSKVWIIDDCKPKLVSCEQRVYGGVTNCSQRTDHEAMHVRFCACETGNSSSSTIAIHTSTSATQPNSTK